MPTDLTKLSKMLSFVLRHKPDAIGLTLDEQGWANVDDLLKRFVATGTPLSREDFLRLVTESDKRRFTLSSDLQRVRAAQGHSVSIDLGLSPTTPPDVLFHGTSTGSVSSILLDGLKPQSRQHVHLSEDEATARRIGTRHGVPAIFIVDSRIMYSDGFHFFRADNGVWLTANVPARYLTAPSSNTTDSATTSRQPKLST
jgi:putative RNA 2'-phosphotransferase